MCSSSCNVGTWGDDGGFCFRKGVPSPGTYSVDTVPTTGVPNTSAIPLAFITIYEDDDIIQLTAPVMIPNFSSNESASNDSFNVDNGLSINIDTTSFYEESVHAVYVDTETSGLPLNEFAERIMIAMWYLGPFYESTGDTP